MELPSYYSYVTHLPMMEVPTINPFHQCGSIIKIVTKYNIKCAVYCIINVTIKKNYYLLHYIVSHHQLQFLYNSISWIDNNTNTKYLPIYYCKLLRVYKHWDINDIRITVKLNNLQVQMIYNNIIIYYLPIK